MVRVVFFQPCIPGNSGNAIRLSAVTGCELHLIEPLGFDLSDAHLRRAGLDYADLAYVTVHPDLEAAWTALAPERAYAFSAHAGREITDVLLHLGDVVVIESRPRTTVFSATA